MKERKIGIMGGTFNPIHYAHLMLAESAREEYQLDRVIFIPAGVPYLKDTSKIPSGDLRYQLVKLAIQNNPYFTCSRLEIDRPGNTYTADTLTELERMYPGDKLYFLLGADSLMEIERWNRIDKIFEKCTLIAAVRTDVDQEKLKMRKAELHARYGAKIELLSLGRVDISSTMIRDRIRHGKSVRYMMPEDCIEFVHLKNFYSDFAIPEEAPDRIYVPARG